MDLPVLTIDQLRNAVQGERVDTVLLAFTDERGRLDGPRLNARHFLDHVLAHGTEASGYLLVPDVETLRPVPWDEGTVLCLADLRSGGDPVAASPRQILRRQLERLSERGLEALAATEPQFVVFDEDRQDATRVEPLIRRIRNEMTAAGMAVEGSKGAGPYEISFRYGPALRIADQHSIFRTGAREIAAQEKLALTFMAKYDERAGSSCHINMSLRGLDDAGFERAVAGQVACLRELTLFYAPNVNSYKRFTAAPIAPGSAVRVVGDRFELRVPGSDVNPYLALAAMVASALHGLERELELADQQHLPRTLAEARELFAASAVAREAFGDEVVEHYCEDARVELEAFESFVTDWERAQGL